jgi:hypothetical protein
MMLHQSPDATAFIPGGEGTLGRCKILSCQGTAGESELNTHWQQQPRCKSDHEARAIDGRHGAYQHPKDNQKVVHHDTRNEQNLNET